MRRNKRLEQRTSMLDDRTDDATRARLGCAFPRCHHPAYLRVEPKRGTFVYWCDVHAEWAWTTKQPPAEGA